MADSSRIPVQNLKTGDRLLSYNVTTGQFAVSTVTRMAVVQTSNMLIIRTQDPQDLRTDNATIQKLYVMKADGTIGWFSVTQLRVGDYLFKALDHRWTMVTNINYISGSFIMYDVYTSAPYNYMANGYLDPPKIPSSPTPGGIVGAGYSLSYTYNGEVVSQITHNDFLAVHYSYDGLGRIINATGPQLGSGTYFARFSYYSNDQVRGVQYGNGLIANYTYDKDSRSSQIKLTNGTTTVLSLNYQYYNIGTVASVSGQARTPTGSTLALSESYMYDSIGRLTNSTTINGSTVTGLWYQYDALGNRLVQGLNGTATGTRRVTTTYGYNPANNEPLNSTSKASPLDMATTPTGAYPPRTSIQHTGPTHGISKATC